MLQPLTERPDAAVYGETPAAKLLMFYDGDETLDEGMGVCVDVIASAPCDYRISEMPRRYQSHRGTHSRLHPGRTARLKGDIE